MKNNDEMPITQIAYNLLINTSLTYQQIAKDTGLNINWLRNYCTKYKKGQDFYTRSVEKLIEYLTRN
jgi:hypothetical protein